MSTDQSIAIYFEHPEWFRPLLAELDRRGIAYAKLDASGHSYDTTAAVSYRLLFNRMSASAYLRGHSQAIFFTRDFLAYVESTGTRVINGSKSFGYEISKAAQLTLFNSLGIPFPRSRVVNSLEELKRHAFAIGFPVIVKPNIGGRGAGIVRLNSVAELEQALAESDRSRHRQHCARAGIHSTAQRLHHARRDSWREVSLRNEGLHHRREF